MARWREVASALESAESVGGVEVHLLLWVCSMSVDSLRSHFRKEGSRKCGFVEALRGLFVSQLSPCYGQETQYHASSLLRPRPVVS
jgi:hypothetical protein